MRAPLLIGLLQASAILAALANQQRESSNDLLSTDFLVSRAAVRDRNKLWPGGRVPYVISTGFTRDERRVIAEAMMEFHKHTCIRFYPRRSNEKNYVNIVKENGCWSVVGKAGGEQKLSLGQGCANVKVTPMHELMHAIGFHHEQSRHDRDRHINVYIGNVHASEHHNYNKVGAHESVLLTPYDHDSVMHYGHDTFAHSGKSAMSRKNGSKKFGNPHGFTRYDILKVNRLYRCQKRPRRVNRCRNRRGRRYGCRRG